jgi:hypothetical protein
MTKKGIRIVLIFPSEFGTSIIVKPLVRIFFNNLLIRLPTEDLLLSVEGFHIDKKGAVWDCPF